MTQKRAKDPNPLWHPKQLLVFGASWIIGDRGTSPLLFSKDGSRSRVRSRFQAATSTISMTHLARGRVSKESRKINFSEPSRANPLLPKSSHQKMQRRTLSEQTWQEEKILDKLPDLARGTSSPPQDVKPKRLNSSPSSRSDQIRKARMPTRPLHKRRT